MLLFEPNKYLLLLLLFSRGAENAELENASLESDGLEFAGLAMCA